MKYFYFLTLLIFLTFIGNCDRQEQPTRVAKSNKVAPIRLGTLPWIGYEPFQAAVEQGILSPNVAKIINFQNSKEITQELQQGNLDLATLTIDEVLRLIEQGEDLVILLIIDVSNGGDSIIAQKQFPDLNSLKGKRIGVERSGVGVYLFSRALQLSNLEKKDFQIRWITSDTAEDFFVTKKIDAVVNFEPTRSRLLRYGGQEIFSSREIPFEIIDVLVAKRSVAKLHASHLKMLINAYFQVNVDWSQHPQKRKDWVASHYNLTAEQADSICRGIYIPSRGENRILLHNYTFLFFDRINLAQQTLLQENIMTKKTTFWDLIDASHL